MLCDYCHKQEAIIHLQEISPDGNKTLNLCPECAIKRLSRLAPGFANLEAALNGLRELIQGKDAKVRLEKVFGQDAQAETQYEMDPETTCPMCKQTFKEFLQTHRLGCQECAKTFAPYLKNYLETTLNTDLPPVEDGLGARNQVPPPSQQSKVTVEEKIKLELQRLNVQLRSAIKREDYEKAAQIRDLIAEFTPTPPTAEEE